jgi:hypothetical protein
MMGEENERYETVSEIKPEKKPRKKYPRKPKPPLAVGSNVRYEFTTLQNEVLVYWNIFEVYCPTKGDHIRHNGKTYFVDGITFNTSSDVVEVACKEIANA